MASGKAVLHDLDVVVSAEKRQRVQAAAGPQSEPVDQSIEHRQLELPSALSVQTSPARSMRSESSTRRTAAPHETFTLAAAAGSAAASVARRPGRPARGGGRALNASTASAATTTSTTLGASSSSHRTSSKRFQPAPVGVGEEGGRKNMSSMRGWAATSVASSPPRSFAQCRTTPASTRRWRTTSCATCFWALESFRQSTAASSGAICSSCRKTLTPTTVWSPRLWREGGR